MNGRILVVDDEPAVVRLISTVLRYRGFEVIEAEGAPQALLAFDKSRAPVDLLLADVDMPYMDGYALADLIKSKLPNCSILLMSGKGLPNATRRYPFLRKPFLPDVLVGRITEIIRSSEPATVI